MEARTSTSTMDSNAPDANSQGYGHGASSSFGTTPRQDIGGGGAGGGNHTPLQNGASGATPAMHSTQGTPGRQVGSSSTAQLSGLMCNVHRTTGRVPPPLIGATTTVVGDKLYVFAGRAVAKNRPMPLTSDMYELDLIRRHWAKIETTGDVPPPRYFHSMCAVGDTKLVCYGGMSPAPGSTFGVDGQGEVSVMQDIHIFDVPTRKWTFIPTQDAPEGRYAHCACVLPSSAAFSSHKAPLSSLQHNPSTGTNEGRIGINIDGSGGSEMVIVGGQDGLNHYIEQISVFNLRSLKWTSTQPFGKACGAYRSVVAPLPPSVTAKITKARENGAQQKSGVPQRAEGGISQEAKERGSSMLIYSNFNFLDVKLELQVRAPDGTLSERPMSGTYSPPGLRFPNGGVLDTFFVVSGTYLTSSKQEYALWALDLRNMTWSRIDAGGSVFSQGSWNRGILWNRRNTFAIFGNRKRSLVEDYNHRQINFSNICMVELEAFGFYDNPRKTNPLSGFVSVSSPYTAAGLSIARRAGSTAGGRSLTRAGEELGEKALALRELADMDILCIGGERIPVNSRIVARRWGPYFVQLLREGTANQDGSDSVTLRSTGGGPGNTRASMLTITPLTRLNTGDSTLSAATTLAGSSTTTTTTTGGATTLVNKGVDAGSNQAFDPFTINAAPTPRSLAPKSRPRCLYLPHTYLTVQALLHFLYTSNLPAPTSPLCTPQILCSMLQIARPYRIDGLLEAVVERLHASLDSRNAAAVFNATAMAAGGGRGIDGTLNPNFFIPAGLEVFMQSDNNQSNGSLPPPPPLKDGEEEGPGNGGFASSSNNNNNNNTRINAPSLRLNTSHSQASLSTGRPPSSGELSATGSTSGSEWSSSDANDSERGARREAWSGELSSVIGLQKRGLRGLMEGRRMRGGPGSSGAGTGVGSVSAVVGAGSGAGAGQQINGASGAKVGLGIAGT